MQAKVIATHLQRECAIIFQSTKIPILVIASIITILYFINMFETYFLAYDITQQIVYHSDSYISSNNMESCMLHNTTTTKCYSYNITYNHGFHEGTAIHVMLIFMFVGLETVIFFIQDIEHLQKKPIVIIDKYMSKTTYQTCCIIWFIIRFAIGFHFAPMFFGNETKLQYFRNNPQPTIGSAIFTNCKNMKSHMECEFLRGNCERCIFAMLTSLAIGSILIYVCIILHVTCNAMAKLYTFIKEWFAQSVDRYNEIKEKVVEV